LQGITEPFFCSTFLAPHFPICFYLRSTFLRSSIRLFLISFLFVRPPAGRQNEIPQPVYGSPAPLITHVQSHYRASPERLHSDSQAARILPLTLPPFFYPLAPGSTGVFKGPSIDDNYTYAKFKERIERAVNLFSSPMQR